MLGNVPETHIILSVYNVANHEGCIIVRQVIRSQVNVCTIHDLSHCSHTLTTFRRWHTAPETPLSEVTDFTKEINVCTDDIITWMTENQLKHWMVKQKLFSFPFLLPWNHPPFPFLTRLLLALTRSPSLIPPRTLDSFSTQTCPWRSTSYKSV